MKAKILGGIFALAVMVAAGYGVNKSMSNDADLSEMALSNVEALAQIGEGESDSGNNYCVMHFPCFDTNGNTTGRYSASSYQGPGCNKSWHSHSCTDCSYTLSL